MAGPEIRIHLDFRIELLILRSCQKNNEDAKEVGLLEENNGINPERNRDEKPWSLKKE